MRVNALNDDGALLQGVARVAAELHGGTHRVGGCAAAEVAVFDKGLIAMALLEGCKPQGPAQLSLDWSKHRGQLSAYFPPQGLSLPDCRCMENVYAKYFNDCFSEINLHISQVKFHFSKV